MSIGTAKPTKKDQAEIPHHFVDCRQIDQHLNAGEFENEAFKILPQIFSKRNLAIVCGGSGLYLNALAYGLDDLPRSDAALREQLESRLQEFGLSNLLDELQGLDPEFYLKIDKANPKRVIRALEVCLLSGTSYTQLRKATKKPRPFKTIWIGIERPREELYSRINKRVDAMMDAGLLKEVKSLMQYRKEEAMKTVGYSELLSYLDGRLSLDEAVELIKRNSRRYAKRQMTWFRRNDEIKWINPDEPLPEGFLPPA